MALPGFTLVAVLLAAFVVLSASPRTAGAAGLEPCETTGNGGRVVEKDGQLTLAPARAARKAWRRSGIRQRLIRPASGLTGRPTFPIGKARYRKTARVKLKGGIRMIRGKKSVRIRGLRVLSAPGKAAYLRASIGAKKVSLLKVRGGKRSFRRKAGILVRIGQARLTTPGAKLLNRRLGLRGKGLRAGSNWGDFNLYSLYKVSKADNPTGETPEVPPVKSEPSGAVAVTSAASFKWYIRDTFIDYVASGEGTRGEGGVTADPPSGTKNLVYSFNFPFDGGWTVPEAPGSPENTLIRGSGLVGFRYCQNTINFTAGDPEIELDGDDASRMIFRVDGTDGTPFPDQRAVMVKLIPSRAESRSEVDNGDGTSTVTYEKIPGYIPAEGTGIFAGFYTKYSPEFDDDPDQSTRPDRFGHLSITYTYVNP